MDFLTIYILSILFIATLVRSTFGFGESLIAVPLLAFLIPVEVAVPLSVLVSIFIAAFVMTQDRKKVHFYSAQWLIIFAALGIPIGLLLLIYGNEIVVKFGLGIFIILYSVYSLLAKNSFKLETDNKLWLFICGFFSGILGGAYGFNGPPIVIYGNLRNWSAKQFRATLQAYFLPAGLIGMLGFWYNELWTSTVTYYFLIALPVIIPAILVGRFINQRLKDDTFLKYIYVGLLCVGALLLGQSIF
ncbi:sulfite exporter TauE/SafE family protein [Brumimicrobium glaciale]|uniref:Probable membrane transporter protein n=1 Tax=Brumimicrobium glaciale TaxID=200475 RepID=A0A4Q4KLI5_9FLAO|nr:sulfite exporter TauE/SafE family protein [Brumimicrobium glaciale]RYM34142.1 sulfite exporter TauE/SafE family protein [Brumimicrobium glaciale]